MKFVSFNRFWTLACLAVFCACTSSEKATFEQVPSSHTNITFNNLITENDSFNVLRFEYIYNGGGVGVGDFNNDGLTDIFFAGNQVSSKLYLNKGDFKFEDGTVPAGVTTGLWCTGVSLIDINQDGWLDIYVSTAHPDKKKSSPNLLFLNKAVNNQGVPKFEEVAQQLGLADTAYATQAAFLDFDRDGDLDMYLLTNALEEYNRNQPVGQRTNGSGKSVDKLYRNEGNNANGMPVFKDVSKEAGIQTEGWGLGVVVNDINQDGWPDVYVANDFLSNDHLWINNQNGTFTNKIHTILKHTEHNGMGVDIADINNDALNDIVAMDMLPEDNLRQKTMFPTIGYDRFFTNLKLNYQQQYVRNMLQLNNGRSPLSAEVTFSDIGYLSGIYATDWSWSSLLADFDNDGYRDLLITNGYRKDVTDLDFVSYSNEAAMFGTDEARLQNAINAIGKLEGVKKPNWLFRNKGDLTFENKAPDWGLAQPSYSNGAAYADFDNDGDLDLVMNNINDEAFVYRNNLNATDKKNYLRIKLAGEKGNLGGYGARLWVYYNGKLQYAEHELQRGYKSTVEVTEHFGLGNTAKVDSVRILWQSGKSQLLKNVTVNQVLTIKEADATAANAGSISALPAGSQPPGDFFTEVSKQYNLVYKHAEDDFPDFKNGQALLPHKHSQAGPAVAVGDVNGDGLDDFMIGGSAHQKATIFYQKTDGTFRKDSLPAKDAEDAGLLLFDADNDGDNDLYCVSGSSEFGKDARFYQDRFYRNAGKGKLQLDSTAVPVIGSSGSCVVGNDYDKDGDIDLFVGGRVSPMEYPMPPHSYLLQNDGKGHFTDITPLVSPQLQKSGMVTSALWTDYDNDGWTDLMLAGEFMPLTFFKNEGGRKFTRSEIGGSIGWWNSLAAGDFDNDGDMDYVAGNLGRNSLYQASEKEPVCVYAKDYDQNGTLDPVLCRYIQGKEYVTHPRETLTDQIVSMRRVLTKYAVYGNSTFKDIFTAEQLKDALILRATYFSSAYIENNGNGRFVMHALPIAAQISPIFGIMVADVNQDGNLDITAVTNDYSTETLAGWYDAGIGLYMQGDGKGHFQSIPASRSGFFVDGDAKAMARLQLANGKPMHLVTQNQGPLKAFVQNSIREPTKTLPLRPDDAYAEIVFANKQKRKEEFTYGCSYLSQSARIFAIPDNATQITIVNSKGASRIAYSDQRVSSANRR